MRQRAYLLDPASPGHIHCDSWHLQVTLILRVSKS